MTCLHCDRPVHGRGLCKFHWQRWKAGAALATLLPKANRWDGREAFEDAQSFRVPERDPCPWCETRGDLGCRHRQRFIAA